MWENVSSITKIADHDYTCYCCGTPIYQNFDYVTVTGTYDGAFMSVKYHTPCHKYLEWYGVIMPQEHGFNYHFILSWYKKMHPPPTYYLSIQ